MTSLGRSLSSRVRWAIAFALLLLAALAVPVFAEETPPSQPPEVTLPSQAEADPSLLPSESDISEGVAHAEDEKAQRAQWLASPEAAQERLASRLAYADLSAAEAQALVRQVFAEQLAALDSDPARFLSAAQLVRPLGADETAATVKDEGDGLLMDAGIPVRTEDEDGDLAKVDLSLEASGQGWETANALSDVYIPSAADEAIEIGEEEGIAITQAGADDERSAQRFGDESVYVHEALPDVGTMVSPVSAGVEVFNVLYSENSAETLRFGLDLPQGAELSPDRFGGAEVLRDGDLLGYVRFPTAMDAQGTHVPVDLEIDGQAIVLEVPHREADLKYPILVDPELVWENWYTANWWNGHGLSALSDGSWQWTANVPWIYASTTPIYATFGGSDRGLFVSTPSGSWTSHNYGQWSYTVPDWDSYIDHASLLPMWRDDHGCGINQYPVPYDFDGLWDGSQWIQLHTNDARYLGYSNLPQWGKVLIFGMGSGGGGQIPCWRDLYVGGAGIWLDDWSAPTLDPLSGAPTGWVNDEKSLAINVSANDPGLGVQWARLYSEASGKWDLWPGCVGTKQSPCPANLSGQIQFNAKGFHEGVSTATVQAYDPTQKGSNWRQFEMRVDRTSPQLTLDGQLAVATDEVGSTEQPPGQGDELSMAAYKLNIKAEDGTPSQLRSGVKDVKVYLDGKASPEPDTWSEQSCPAGSCKMEVTYTLKPFELASGPHTLKVVGIDHAGNETKPERKIEFEYFPATGIKDDYVLHYIPLPDGQGDEEGEEVPDRPELAVNVMNGNLVYREKDIEVDGKNADLEVERYYNSLLPEEDNTEWGDGWTLAQAPELEVVEAGGSPDRALVQSASAALESPELPEQAGGQVFDPVMQATITKLTGGGYEVDPETGEGESIVFDQFGKVDEVRAHNGAKVDYSYANGPLSEIAIEEPPALGLPPMEVEVPDPPTFSSAFGAKGGEEGQLETPQDVALGLDGDIWVADTANGRIQRFDADGQHISTPIEGLSWPTALAVDPRTGDLLVADRDLDAILRFAEDGEYLSEFGTTGTGPGEFGPSGPTGVAVDAAGDVWASDPDAGRVQKFDPEGQFLLSAGSLGSAPGQLFSPRGIDTGPDGSLWVADWEGDRISVFSAEGEFLRRFAAPGSGKGQLTSPWSVEVDSRGNAWVGDMYGRVQQFAEDGSYLNQFGAFGQGQAQFLGPRGIAVDYDGNVWVADQGNNRVQEWHSPSYLPAYASSFGAYGSGNGQVKAPADVALDAAGDLWMIDKGNSRIQKFDADGQYVSGFGSAGSGNGQLGQPAALAVDARDHIWVADTQNNRLQEFDPSGKYLSQFGSKGSGGGQLQEPEGIAVDQEENLWVSDTGNGRVQKLDGDGEVLKVIDANAVNSSGFKPTGIDAGPGGQVWVTDWQNNQVIVLDDEGKLVRKFGSAGTGIGQFNRPDAIDVEAGGRVWVGDQNNGRAQQFNQSGEYVSEFGSTGSGAGQFSFARPMGIATDNQGGVLITDVNNHRIQKWEAAKPLAVVQGPVEGLEAPEPAVEIEVDNGLVSSVEGEEAGEHAYEHEGDLLASHDGPAGETRYEYDSAGRITKIVLPNETTATIEYEQTYGRVKSATVDPAGPEGERTISFAYDDDKRETKVTEPGVPTITYFLGVDGSVFRWAPVATPPAFDDIGGSLSEYLDSTSPIPDRDHELTISATALEQVTSVKVLKDGSQLLAEQTCSSTPEGRCDLEWVTSARAHSPGRLDLEFIITDAEGRSAAERHFVTIPYLPPPDPAAPVKPNFEHIKQFRKTYGLDLDLAGNQKEISKRIWKLLELWELQEPVARASTDAWGAPLRSADWAELNYRQSYIAQAASVIPSYGTSHASTFAGYYVDHAAGGTLNIGFTADAESNVAALKSVLDAPDARIQSFTAVRTFAHLKQLEGAIASDWQSNPTLRSQITSLGINQQTNKVRVGSTDPGATSTLLSGQGYSAAAIEVAETEPHLTPPAASRYGIRGEVQAGDSVGSCTAGFGAWDKAPDQRGGYLIRYFTLIAGHCGNVGQEIGRTDSNLDNESIIGVFGRDAYDAYLDYTTDAAAIRLRDPDTLGHTIFLSPTTSLRVRQPIGTYPGMTVCQSGGRSQVPRCGPILTEGGAVSMAHSRGNSCCTLTAQVPSAAGVIHGDSGGPVYDQATGRPVGLVTGAQHGQVYGLRECIPEPPSGSDCPVLGFTPLLPVQGAEGILERLYLHLAHE